MSTAITGRTSRPLTHRAPWRCCATAGCARSRPRPLVGPPALIGADRSMLVEMRCSPGVGHCYGDVSVRAAHRSAANGFDIRPGARARVPVLIGGLRVGSRVTVILRGLGCARQRVQTLVRGSDAADRRRSCRPPGAVVVTQNDIATVISGGLGSAAAVCLKATGRTLEVPIDYPDEPFALRGHWFVGMGRNSATAWKAATSTSSCSTCAPVRRAFRDEINLPLTAQTRGAATAAIPRSPGSSSDATDRRPGSPARQHTSAGRARKENAAS